MRRLLIAIALAALVAGVFAVWKFSGLEGRVAATMDPSAEAAFKQWLARDEERQSSFDGLEAFLRHEGVADIVPTWQLTRTDTFYAGRCNLGHFNIPPEELWPNIIPALRLVQESVIPAVGEVEVRSSWRSEELNRCARGANRSKHLQFAALDLVAADGASGPEFYHTLCSMHRRTGPRSRMGLGAYYDPARPNNAGGRFHIDGEGFRQWGRKYTAASSPCTALLGG